MPGDQGKDYPFVLRMDCPACGDGLQAAMKTGGEEGPPEPGSLLICARCKALLVVTAERGLEVPDEKVAEMLERHPDVVATRKLMARAEELAEMAKAATLTLYSGPHPERN